MVEVPFGTLFVTGKILQGTTTVTTKVHEEVQLCLEVLSVKVKVPAPVAFTLTVAPMAEPTIVPLPVIDQEWVTLSDGFGVLVYRLFVEPAKTEVLPEIEHKGVGLTVNVRFRESLVTLQSAPDEWKTTVTLY